MVWFFTVVVAKSSVRFAAGGVSATYKYASSEDDTYAAKNTWLTPNCMDFSIQLGGDILYF